MSTTEYEKQKPPLPVLILRLRALVLALGESTTPAWWNTQCLNEAGLRFLERLYPRTSFHAAIHAAGKAASDAHDRAVGRIGVYHLFRLPESLEAEIHRAPPVADQDFFSVLRAALNRPEPLLELLAPLCGDADADAAPGARKIGTDQDLMTPAGFRKTAAVYHQAFLRRQPGFPYFTAEPVVGPG